MDELPAHAKAVLRRAQQHDQCQDDDARRRVREGVARAVGPSALGARALDRAPVAAQPSAPATASAPLFAAKLTVTVVLVALVGSGIALRLRGAALPASSDARAAVVASAPPPAASAGLSGSPAPLVGSAAELPKTAPKDRQFDVQTAVPPRPGRRSRAAPPGSRAAPHDTLDVEVGLMRLLAEAVSRRDLHQARRLLAQHDARFPRPLLLEERQGFSALLRCMDGSPGALAASRAFVARYPSSVLTARVLHECEPEER